MNHRYTTKTGIVVLVLTLLCTYAWQVFQRGYSPVSSIFTTLIIGIVPITWFPAIMAMVFHEWLHERYEAKVQAKARKLIGGKAPAAE